MVNNIIKKISYKMFKQVTKIKKFNTLFSKDSENLLGQNSPFSPKKHHHDFLKEGDVAKKTFGIQGNPKNRFSEYDHSHKEYAEHSINKKENQDEINGFSKTAFSQQTHNHNQYTKKSKNKFLVANKLYDQSKNSYLSPKVIFSSSEHSHNNFVPFLGKTKYSEGIYSTYYMTTNNITIPMTNVIKPSEISLKSHDHNNIYLTKELAVQKFAPKNFSIKQAKGTQISNEKTKIKIYKYVPDNGTITKNINTFDTNILTTERFEREIATVSPGAIFRYIDLGDFHTAWRRNVFSGGRDWSVMPGDLNEKLGLDLGNLFNQPSIPANNNTSSLLSALVNTSGSLDGVNLKEIYGKNASTQFIILFANKATQKKLEEIGPKPIIEYTPDKQTVNVDIHRSMYKCFKESGKKQDVIKTSGANQYLYNKNSRSYTDSKSVSSFKSTTKNWVGGLTTSAGFALKNTDHKGAFYSKIDSWYNNRTNYPSGYDKLYLKGLNRNEYYWFYDVPAQPDLGEESNIFEYITETMSLVVENFFKKIFNLFIVLLLVVDYFLCWGINYIFSLMDQILFNVLSSISLFHIYVDMALFKIDWMPATFLFNMYDMFILRKPYVPIAKFATSNPQGGNLILLSKEVSTRFNTEWRRVIGHTPVIKTPYQMLNSLKVEKDTSNPSVVFINPVGQFNLNKDYVKTLNSWVAKTGVPKYTGPHLLKYGERSYTLIDSNANIDWKQISFSANASGKEITVNNYGVPFTLIAFEEED